MNPQSSLAKGDAFEIRVHDALKFLIGTGDFYVRDTQSQIFWKKKYYSAFRQKDITFDLAIEVFLSGKESPSLVIVVECKDYKNPVPVDDLEEFGSKLSGLQAQLHCLKGIVISSSGFESGAVTFAKNQGIGLARLSSDKSFDWIVPRIERQGTDADAQLELAKQLTASKGAFVGHDGWNFYTSLPSLLIAYKAIDHYSPPLRFLHVPFRSSELIEDIIADLPEDLYTGGRLGHEQLLGFLEERYDATIRRGQDLGFYNTEPVLGHLSLDPIVVSLSNRLDDDICRMRFTLAHEVGHLILHRDDLLDYVDEIADFDHSLGRVQFSDASVNRSLEIQANIFASRLLLPTEPVLEDVAKYFREQNLHKDHIYWDHQPVNQALAYGLLDRLKSKYLASKEASRIRLTQLGVIKTPTGN